MKRKYRKPARWAIAAWQPNRQTVALGLPGRAPSPEARMLAASPTRLPVGAWHMSDHAVADLTRIEPVISEAIHLPSGSRFRLASLPDGPILALEAVTVAAEAVLTQGSADPTSWANRQEWRIVPPTPPSRLPHATLEDGWLPFEATEGPP